MQEFLYNIIPNVMKKLPVFYQAIIDTIVMTAWSGIISFVIGLVFGIILVVTKKGAIMENKIAFHILDKLTNFFRSIPFIILLTGVMPLSRAIMGTAIGVRGAIVPLIFGAVPFFARQVESALADIDSGLIEAAQSMGLSNMAIIFRVYLREGAAGISRATTITLISLLGLTAMAGAVGAGGLGNFAIMYGHDRNQTDVTWITIVVLVAMVSLIQIVGGIIAKKKYALEFFYIKKILHIYFVIYIYKIYVQLSDKSLKRITKFCILFLAYLFII